MHGGSSVLTRTLIDAYALIGRRVWALVGPRSELKRPQVADNAHRAV